MSVSVLPVFATGINTLIIITGEESNIVDIYENDTIKYTEKSDAKGKIIIKNIEDGEYKAVFRNDTYQSFDFSLPYNGEKTLTAYPKKIPETTTVPDTETARCLRTAGCILPDNHILPNMPPAMRRRFSM